MNEEQDKKGPSAMEKFFAEFLRIGKETNFGFGSNKTAIKLLSKKMKMTQQEKIEQAARKYGCDAYIEYCRQHGVDAATAKYPSLENAFITGAEWMLQNMWISVDEELPPIDDGLIAISKDVIVRNEYGKTTTAWYSYSARNWHLCYGEIQGDDLIHSKITHWMEIPTEGGE